VVTELNNLWIAFGEAASYCLEYYSKSFNCSRLCGLIAYYPTVIPDTRTSFALSLPVLVHLAGKTIDVLAQPQALGLQGKRRRKTRPIQPGLGTGERMTLAYPAFTYEYAEPGFAEHDMEEYNNLAADIAWTRTVKALRKGFSRDADHERRWDDHQEGILYAQTATHGDSKLELIGCSQILQIKFVQDVGGIRPEQSSICDIYIDVIRWNW
jgi:dienelactone hydrolase